MTAPLRHRGFRLLVGGQLASNFGDAFYAVALPWYVLAEHGGAALLGTVLVAYGVPRTVLLAVGGHASDRWRPWTVMMSSDVVRAVALVGMAVAASVGPARAVILVPIAVVLGAGEGMFLPGSFAIVPSLLPDDDLQAGNSLTAGGTALANLAGPALGGALVAFVGPASAFAIDAGTFVVSAITLAGIRAVHRAPAVAVPETKPTVRGLLRSQRVLQVMLLITVAANLGSGGLGQVALPSLAHGPLHTGATGYGAMIAAEAVGALLGTIAAGQVRRLRRPAVVASIAFLVEAAFMAAVPYVGGIVAASVALALFGALNGFGNVITITAFQRWAPPSLLGGVTGLLMLAAFGIFPVSAALGAVVVSNLGPALFFPIAAAALVLAVGGGLTQRAWRDIGTSTQHFAAASVVEDKTHLEGTS
ncbi:MAG TPA: MFS transporter [Pseudonocardiaceae bacterium]|jgi:predicted MFS family arabinose efflux permease|nr:MFS transporter [Pseudonocardiaceae bacterium]